MPLYYSSAPPTSNNKNSITRTATDFKLRDFLLTKNIQNPIRYPQLSTSINGAPRGGEPVLDTMVGSGSIIQQDPLEVDGIFRYENAIIMNHYKNTEPNAPEILDIEDITKINIFPTSPNGITNYQDEDIEKYGLLAKSNYKKYRELSTIKNLYVDTAKQIDMADIVSLQPIQTAQQLTSYLDEYGNLNLGANNSTQAADIIGSILNGQGLGLAKGGIVTNYDIRASLAGRVLTSTGFMNDTKLGVIGGQQLVLALANNAAYNTQQSIFGSFNVEDNILSLVKDGNLPGFRPNYKITVPEGTANRILDTVSNRILGFTVPRSYLNVDGSIFSNENGYVGNIERTNSMILNTGKGQVKSLIANIRENINNIKGNFRSGYAPGYKYKDIRGLENIDFNVYAYMYGEGYIYNFIGEVSGTSVIPSISYNRSKEIEKYGFTGIDNYTLPNVVNFPTKFTWTSGNGDAINALNGNPLYTISNTYLGNKKTLLAKTQKLFNDSRMKTLVSVKGDKKITDKTQIQTSVSPNGFVSKGSGVLQGSMFNKLTGQVLGNTGGTPDNTFCRVWTPTNRYDKVGKLIRHRGLNQNENGGQIIPEGNPQSGAWRQSVAGSVLDDNGFVKITPYKGEDLTRQATDPKKYMFSIENLAWAGSPAVNLLPCEQGPGDPLTGKFGRIMWFPPYDLTFSETSSLNIESTNFIGRGEPIYTYNNTERTGSLSFKIIIDHPTIMNAFGKDEASLVENDFIASFFAGCLDLDNSWGDKLSVAEKYQEESKVILPVLKKTITKVSLPPAFKIFFKNDNVDVADTITSGYEMGTAGSAGIGSYQSIPLEYRKQPDGSCVKQSYTRTWNDDKSFGLNNYNIQIGTSNLKWTDSSFRTELLNYLNNDAFKGKQINISVKAYASTQGCDQQNTILSNSRASNIKTWLQEVLTDGALKNKVVITALGAGETGPTFNESTQQWEKSPKQARYAEISFNFNDAGTEVEREQLVQEDRTVRVFNDRVRRRLYNECDFFNKLTDEDPLVFDKIREKIKYFHPAFHSTTPEGFNARLTFLLQCTRQGPTINSVDANNLAFGPSPVCILRIGDFYNTKIIMDNVSFDFEPLVWDLNPEGVGVQPMIANVTISFKYIGGSSLYGPINKLQNALSFNYFANTHVYDARADYIAKDNGKRPVFGDTSNSQTEDTYKLVRGLDLTKTSMVTYKDNEAAKTDTDNAQTPDIDQKESADNANSEQENSDAINVEDEGQRLKLGELTITAAESQYATVFFRIYRKNPNDVANFSQLYKIKPKVINTSKNIMYSTTIETPYGIDRGPLVVFQMADTENGTSFTGFNSTDIYNLRVDLIGEDDSRNITLNMGITKDNWD